MAALLELEQKPFIELKISALVEENRIKPKRVGKFIDNLESRILSIKKINYEKLLNRSFRLPIIGRPNAMSEDYPRASRFRPPEGIEVIGGFRTATALKRTNAVDLAIRMPESYLEKKDIKNQRYHQKRALYLAQLAHLLNGSIGLDLIEKLEFCYHQGDFLKPVLLITPQDPKLKNNTTFQLFVYPHPNSPLSINLLAPAHGNVSPKWFFKDFSFGSVDEKVNKFIQGDSVTATSPFYNSSILFDMELVSNSDLLFEQIGTQPSINEALILTKIWLYQRELHHHFSFIVSMFVAYLQTKQIVHQNMSSYQIFKTITKSLASSDWDATGLSYYEDFKNRIAAFRDVFPVIFLSPSGNLNLCHNITADLYNRLKHEAQISHASISKNAVDTFELLFLTKIDFANKFDILVHLPKCTKKLPHKLEFLEKFMDHGVFIPRVYSTTILDLIKRALTDRVVLIQQSSAHLLLNKTWNLKSIPYDPSNEDNTFTLGLLLDPEKSLRIIDTGPEAQTQDAEEFREFWDPKSQLRLQNGLISETVVWHVDSFSQRREIIKYIFNHALKKADISNVVVHYTLLERFLKLDNLFFRWRDEAYIQAKPQNGGTNGKPNKRKRPADDEEDDHNDDDDADVSIEEGKAKTKPIGVGEEIFQRVLRSYNELNKVLRGVEKLKYAITSIQPMSQHLRATSVFPPMPVCLQQKDKSLKRRKGVTLFPEDFSKTGRLLHVEPVEVLLTLEGTGKWPNEWEALEAAIVDYLIDLGERLKERDYSVKFSEDFLDVLHGQFVFRLRIKCPKEMALISSHRGKAELQRRRMELDILPKVHAALDQLYRERPAFGLTCRLVKRWFACHLMTGFMSELTIELIVAHLFLHPEPYTEPASSFCGFRRFLMLMGKYDWKASPLVVNFDNQLKIDEVTKLQDLLQEDRDKYPALVVCTPFDKEVSPWTRNNLTADTCEILCNICSKAYQFLDERITFQHQVIEECKALFRPNFKLFNLIIKLHTNVVQNFFMTIDPPKGFKLSGKEPLTNQASSLKVMPIVDLNVVEQFVKLLRDKYDHLASFHYDRYGQRVIGIILKPESEKLLGGSLKTFISEMKQMGSKLIDSITLVKPQPEEKHQLKKEANKRASKH